MPIVLRKPVYPEIDRASSLTTGLAIALALQDGAGSTARDLTGGGDATKTAGTATWVGADLGWALRFDGSTYWEVANPSRLDSWSALSVDLWFRSTNGMVDFARLLERGDNNEFTLIFNRVSGSGKLTVQELNSASPLLTSSANLCDGKWHHVAVTVSSAYLVKLYVDGRLDGSATSPAPAAKNHTPLRIGEYGGGTGYKFVGDLGAFTVWTRELTAADVRLRAATDPWGLVEPPSLSLLPFGSPAPLFFTNLEPEESEVVFPRTLQVDVLALDADLDPVRQASIACTVNGAAARVWSTAIADGYRAYAYAPLHPGETVAAVWSADTEGTEGSPTEASVTFGVAPFGYDDTLAPVTGYVLVEEPDTLARATGVVPAVEADTDSLARVTAAVLPAADELDASTARLKGVVAVRTFERCLPGYLMTGPRLGERALPGTFSVIGHEQVGALPGHVIVSARQPIGGLPGGATIADLPPPQAVLPGVATIGTEEVREAALPGSARLVTAEAEVVTILDNPSTPYTDEGET